MNSRVVLRLSMPEVPSNTWVCKMGAVGTKTGVDLGMALGCKAWRS